MDKKYKIKREYHRKDKIKTPYMFMTSIFSNNYFNCTVSDDSVSSDRIVINLKKEITASIHNLDKFLKNKKTINKNKYLNVDNIINSVSSNNEELNEKNIVKSFTTSRSILKERKDIKRNQSSFNNAKPTRKNIKFKSKVQIIAVDKYIKKQSKNT